MSKPLVSVEDLHVSFGTGSSEIRAVRGVSFEVYQGECLAIVGESGSGKSVTARCLVGLAGPGARVETRRFEVNGVDARRFRPGDWRRVRGGFAGLVLQNALGALDPLRPVGTEIGEVLRTHDVVPRAHRGQRIWELLTEVHVPEPDRRARQYPHQLSGGLRQRALIASAIAADPPLLIADEPTTALDVTVQAQILRLLAARRAAGSTLLLISHDLAVVSRIADRVLVFKDGRVAESGATARLLSAPAHPYTRKLLQAVPSAASRGRRLSGPGLVPAVSRSPETVIEARGLGKQYGDCQVVNDFDLVIRRGEIVGLVGESGSGKTTVAQLLFGLVKPTAGEVRFEGHPWSALPERRRRTGRRRLQFIAQDPLSSFDPRWTVRRIVAEAAAGAAVLPLLERVGLGANVLDRHPRHLSGGERQRVAIARALAPQPRLIICDEPVSALDVLVQAQVLDLLCDIRATDGTAILLISHDLGVVHHLADQILVMHDGAVVERGSADDVFHRPAHDYTRALLAAAPALW